MQLQSMVPIIEILLLIQLQGGNNLADPTPKTVCVEKLGTLSKHGTTVHHYLAFSIGPPYLCSEFSIKIGDVIALIVIEPTYYRECFRHFNFETGLTIME